jgi:tetratricopeptide (TPR) repeat protein
MRFSLLFLILASNLGFTQTKLEDLKFDTKYYNATDKWVAFPKKASDSTYLYGFIYLDPQAGFTLNYETNFFISEKGLKSTPRDSTIGFMKVRLTPKTSLVTVLNKKQMTELNLPEVPDWLSVYKEGANEINYLKSIGYHYNHVGACELALIPLEKAYSIEPHYEGLEFELAYAYNALKQFEKAITILDKAIKNNPNNFYFYRELGYSYKNINLIDKAEATYKKGIKISGNDFEKSEMAVNMAQSYFQLKNKKKFKQWAKLTRKYAEPNSQYVKYIELFEKQWDKN